MNKLSILTLAALLLTPLAALHAAATGADGDFTRQTDGLRLAQAGQSRHVVFCAANAPASVHEAAKAIQRAATLCAGVELPLSRQPMERMICLGDNEAYRKFLADTEFAFALYGESESRHTVPIWKGEDRGP